MKGWRRMRNTCSLEMDYCTYENCFFYTKRDPHTKVLSIQAYYINEDGEIEPLLTVTVGVGVLPPHQVAIKNHSENAGLLTSLQKLGIVKRVVTHITTGFVSIPICELDEEILKEYAA